MNDFLSQCRHVLVPSFFMKYIPYHFTEMIFSLVTLIFNLVPIKTTCRCVHSCHLYRMSHLCLTVTTEFWAALYVDGGDLPCGIPT